MNCRLRHTVLVGKPSRGHFRTRDTLRCACSRIAGGQSEDTRDADRLSRNAVGTQRPVAGELRDILGSLQIIADVERMGALAVHVAKDR